MNKNEINEIREIIANKVNPYNNTLLFNTDKSNINKDILELADDLIELVECNSIKDKVKSRDILIQVIDQVREADYIGKSLQIGRSKNLKDARQIIKAQDILAKNEYCKLSIGYRGYKKIKGKETTLTCTKKLREYLPDYVKLAKDNIYYKPEPIIIKDCNKNILSIRHLLKTTKDIMYIKKSRQWIDEKLNNQSFDLFIDFSKLDEFRFVNLLKFNSLISISNLYLSKSYFSYPCVRHKRPSSCINKGKTNSSKGRLNELSVCFYDRKINKIYDLRNHYYHRVFSNSTIEEGGRYYSEIQKLPSNLRSFLIFRGEETVELDYTNMQLRMLYNIEQENPLGDLYQSTKYTRKKIKNSLLIAFNVKGNSVKKQRDRLRKLGKSETVIFAIMENNKKILKYLRKKYKTLSKYFYSGVGLKLQRIDSDIVYAVVDHFIKKNIPILTIHDSFIVQKRYRDELYEVMMSVYEKKLGFAPEIH